MGIIKDLKKIVKRKYKIEYKIEKSYYDLFRKNSVIMVEDEMNLNQETKTKNIWYQKGKEPVIEAKRKGESQNFYGALNKKKEAKIWAKPLIPC